MVANKVDVRLQRVLERIEGDDAAIDLVSKLVDELNNRRPRAWGTGLLQRIKTSLT
jgi:hypothetical protein